MNDPHPSKDLFFERLGALADAMIAAYGKDFAMGALVLAARFVAEGRQPADTSPGMNYQGESRRGVAP
ncbi:MULTISPECIES: hypothetical protein [Paraburkholderia]|jgi:hypothetical protein|uniref:Uncharacterized protein n=1 Tax=Paraburkholderia hospita TaxID=169430 RepID=A0AAJ4W1S0_9BURK|nr:hypothetical protein [Paraburkholderia hospita]AUT70758.1 hypothetical protein C2L64_20500 [Paraburkholderia hospita]AXF01826.1 hypothetical protein CUJ88_25905 [Paraburkholderia hospita]EIM95882.1 hypothetical protein WQE_37022 [Paraburkholderia hospita]OUL69520.1 hypothetical protein CA601_49240 [Paraburkholderia hospita]OUL77606.1 hypothetical protein CA602_32905 [Paraburkholderia hospita]